MAKKQYTKLWKWQLATKEFAKCSGCDRLVENMTVDHIIPIAFLESVGLTEEKYEDEDNFQLLCRQCNSFKGNRIDMRNPKSIPLLKKYITKLEELYK